MELGQLPRVDFNRIPTEFDGQWVVVRVGKAQEVLGSGTTAVAALKASGVPPDDPTAVLTEVPTAIPVAYVGQASSD